MGRIGSIRWNLKNLDKEIKKHLEGIGLCIMYKDYLTKELKQEEITATKEEATVSKKE